MDDLRTKYQRARRAKNQANYRARNERAWAAASWQNSQTWLKTAADAKAQALTAEREARAAREALRARDRNIERQNLLLAELQRDLSLARGQLEDALAREAKGNNGTERLNDLRMRLKEARKIREEALQLTAANKSALHDREARAAREAVALKDRAIHSQLQRINELERQNGILRDQLRTALYRPAHDSGGLASVSHACECSRQAREATERAMARIEPHARQWWQRLVWWPKSDGSR